MGEEGAGGKRYYDSWLFFTHLSGFLPDPPKKVTMVIENPTPIREGDTVTLSCNYSSSNPIVNHYEWKPRGAWEEPSLGVLKIQNIGWNNTAIACAACNNWCSWASPVTLNVLCESLG